MKIARRPIERENEVQRGALTIPDKSVVERDVPRNIAFTLSWLSWRAFRALDTSEALADYFIFNVQRAGYFSIGYTETELRCRSVSYGDANTRSNGLRRDVHKRILRTPVNCI